VCENYPKVARAHFPDTLEQIALLKYAATMGNNTAVSSLSVAAGSNLLVSDQKEKLLEDSNA